MRVYGKGKDSHEFIDAWVALDKKRVWTLDSDFLFTSQLQVGVLFWALKNIKCDTWIEPILYKIKDCDLQFFAIFTLNNIKTRNQIFYYNKTCKRKEEKKKKGGY